MKSLADMLDKQDKIKENRIRKKQEESKCHGCVWGTWTGIRYYCGFGVCVKGKM